MSTSHTVIRQAPDNLRPLAVRILRQGVGLVASGDSPALGAAIRHEWVGWSRLDKLRLTTVFAWTAAYLLTQIDDPAQRDEFLANLEAL